MFEKEQIAKLEYLFNYYSRRYSLYVYERNERHANMTALQTLQRAVKIFGYKFVVKGMAMSSYREYQVYELVKINELGEKKMLALALYEEKYSIPKEVIVLKEGNYDDEDYKKSYLEIKRNLRQQQI